MAKELLKEAIADAKAVREVALQNAKMALEEAFDSKIKNMLSAKLAEELEEDVELEEEYVDEEVETTDEAYSEDEDGDKVDEAKDDKEDVDEAYMEDDKDEVDEEINLDELMAELDEVSDEDIMSEEELEDRFLPEGLGDTLSKMGRAAGAALRGGGASADTTLSDALRDIAKTASSVEDWRNKAKAKGEELLKKGEGSFSASALNAVVNSPNWARFVNKIIQQQATSEAEIAEANSDFDIDALIAEIEKEADDETVDEATGYDEKVGGKGRTGFDNKVGGKGGTGYDGAVKKLKEERDEAMETVKSLQETLSEMNLLNSKLLYCNKLFRANALTEAQKVKVVDALDMANTANEAKLVFSTLQESFNFTGVEKRAIQEGLGRASKASGNAPKKVITESVDETVSRFQKLANIKF